MAVKEKEVDVQAEPTALTELQVKLTELQEALAGESEKRAEADQRATQLTEALDASNERIALMEKDAQVKRFTAMVEGDNRWYGETDKHLKVLSTFSETFGEDSEEFQTYVTQQQALAEQIKVSGLLEEVGHSKTPAPATATEKLDVLAKKISAEKDITYQQAYTEALQSNPDLYNQHVKGE